MGILEIKKYPEKVLRGGCIEVSQVGKREKDIFSNMLETMRYFKGIGLAAPQVGIKERMIIADIGDGPVFLANPEIVRRSGNDVLEEGCLSVPHVEVSVERNFEILVKGIDQKGKEQEIKAKGLLARVFQHEIDHLDGKLIIDYLPWLELARFMKEKDSRE